MNRSRIAVVATVLYALAASVASAQFPAVKVQTDSIRQETCRGGTLSSSGLTCTGATAAGRVTVIRRLANRIDSIVKALPSTPAPAPGGHLGFAARYYWQSDSMYWPNAGVDTVTVCGVLENTAGQVKLMWPAIRLTPVSRTLGTAIQRDSSTWGNRGGNAPRIMCSKAYAANPALSPDSLQAIPVTWTGSWFPFKGVTLWRPFFAITKEPPWHD